MSDRRKEEEMFRFLYVEGNAYYKQQLADMLGMKDHHFDKYYRDFKKQLYETEPDYLVETKKNKYVYHRFKYDAYTFNKNILISFYQKNHFSKLEVQRTSDILRTLKDEPMSLKQLNEFLEGDDQTNRTSYRRTLDYLKNIGVVKKEAEIYSLDNDLFDGMTTEELHDLYFFVHYAANTNILSVPGYLLLDFLSVYLNQREETKNLDVLWFRFINYARVLNEYKCHDLLKAMEGPCYITFRYYMKNQKQRAHTKNDQDYKPPMIKLIPLYIIYEHQYGRWYLIGKNENYQNYSIYKLEGIGEIEINEKVEDGLFTKEQENALRAFHNSWFVSTAPETTVKLKFYYTPQPNKTINFIEERVKREAYGGEFVETDEPNTFIYSLAVNGTKEIKPWILSFGSSVEVLEPKELRDEMIQEWKQILEEYENV